MDEDEREALIQLKHTKLFSEIGSAVLEKFISETTPVTWKKSETISSDVGVKYMHIILGGRLKLTQIDPSTGRSMTLFLLTTGDVYDIFTLLDGEEHIVFPVAIDDVKVLRIPIQRAREWLYEYPLFNKTFLPYLGEMMRHLEAFSESLVFDDTTTRLSKLILRHALPKEDENHTHYPVKLIHNLSHEALAEMIGSVRSVVSSQMHKLKEEDIILSQRGHLAIKNLEALIHKSAQLEHCIYEKLKKKKSH